MIKFILRILLVSALCISSVLISLMIAAIVISKTDFKYESLIIVTNLIIAVNSFICSFLISRFHKQNGLICGIYAAVTISLFIVVTAISNNTFKISPILLSKLCAVFIAGAAGGIIGVNTN